jgi:hypothetical protein
MIAMRRVCHAPDLTAPIALAYARGGPTPKIFDFSSEFLSLLGGIFRLVGWRTIDPFSAATAGVATSAFTYRVRPMPLGRADLPHSESFPIHFSGHALRLLLEAYACARDLGCDLWDFAVEIEALHCQGVTNTQVRWLLRKGYIDQALEKTQVNASQRSFSHVASPILQAGTCFVMTEADVAFAGAAQLPPWPATNKKNAQQPFWDSALRELRLGEVLVKRFRQPAANQELILEAFQEEDWPVRIDDPLPPVSGQDSKQRLHSAISNFNRRQANRLIWFAGGGDGKSVSWRLLHAASDTAAKTGRS